RFLVLFLSAALCACDRASTLLVVNTSSDAKEITVYEASNGDVFARETVAPGKEWCWNATDPAHGRRVMLSIAPAAGTALTTPLHTPWVDTSLTLDRSWTIRVHSDHFVADTIAWNQ